MKLTPLETAPSTDGWHEILATILDEMGCQTGTLHRYEPTSTQLGLVAQIGIPDELLEKVNLIPLGKGIAGAAAERREAVQLCNLQTDSSGVAAEGAKKTQVSGSLAVPVLEGEDLIGTLGVGMVSPHEFSETESDRLWQISRWLSPMLSVWQG